MRKERQDISEGKKQNINIKMEGRHKEAAVYRVRFHRECAKEHCNMRLWASDFVLESLTKNGHTDKTHFTDVL